MIRAHVLICGGTGCTSSGSQSIQQAFTEQLEKNGLTEEIKIVQTGCFGLCALGLFGICRAKDLGIESDEGRNGDVVSHLKVACESAKRGEVACGKLGIDRKLTGSTRLVLHRDIDVNLCSCNSVLLDI